MIALIADPHRTLCKLANGISYPPEHLPLLADILADNPEVNEDVALYILSGLARLPDTERRTVAAIVPRFRSDPERALSSVSFITKLKLIAEISERLISQQAGTLLDAQWHQLVSAWLDSLEQQKRRAA